MAFMSQEDFEKLLAKKQAEIDDLHARLAASEASQQRVAVRASQDEPLRERERRALLLIKEMCQAVILLDMHGMILETNQAGLDPEALRRDSRIGHQLWEPSSWSGSRTVQDQIKAMFEDAAATGEFVRKEIEIPNPGNVTERMVIDISFKAIDNGEKKFSFVLFEGRDITKRKQAEEEVARKNVELQALYEQVRKLDQLKSMFFAMMNHELRTPLTLILGPTESLLQQASLTQEVRQALEMVTRNARLLLKLVNDLLEISRLEQGKLELRYTTCNLSRVVNLLAANFTLAAEGRHITYDVQVPTQLMVEVDAARIERVLLNLLSNAFKFTPDGGHITCSLAIEPPSQDATADSEHVVLTVQDSGPGVPVEMREMIFEHFRQTEEGAKRRFGGTGLGLAIAKDLVGLHGGTIQVDEATGGGSRFTIRLPRYAPTGTNVQEEEDADLSEPTDARLSQTIVEDLLPAHTAFSPLSCSSSVDCEQALVLIVEDHPQMRQFLSEQLSSHYRVVEATNGQEGLDLARRVHPDLILTDIMMPIMSGDEMLAALRSEPEYDDIPLVILSARGNDELRVKLLRTGAQDYLVKPFSPEELQVRLGNLLMLHRTRRLLQTELASSQQNVETLARELATRNHDLEAQSSRLHVVNKQQSNFVAIVSHEFRTALTSIQGFSELLTEQEFGPQEIKEFALDITTDARRLTRMINEMLDLERMKSGKMTIRCEPVDVNALLREHANQAQRMTVKYIITCILDDALPLVPGDQDKLIQVVSNLLSNAMKYSPEGGEILLRSLRERDTIQICIQDQGIGIPEEAQKDIFAPYSRIASTQTRYIGGTGLGLSVVREIIHLHGGTIWVESIPGNGATFHFTLPLIRPVPDVSLPPT